MKAWTFEKKLRRMVENGFMKLRVTKKDVDDGPLEMVFTGIKKFRMTSKQSRHGDLIVSDGCKVTLDLVGNPVGFLFANTKLPPDHDQRNIDTTFEAIGHFEYAD